MKWVSVLLKPIHVVLLCRPSIDANYNFRCLTIIYRSVICSNKIHLSSYFIYYLPPKNAPPGPLLGDEMSLYNQIQGVKVLICKNTKGIVEGRGQRQY